VIKRSSRGTSTIEYALMVAALAGGTAAATMIGLGPAVQEAFQHVIDQFTIHAPTPGPDGGTDGSGSGSGSASASPSATPSPTDIPTP